MKKSKVETAETRKRIVELAAQAFKTKGIDATGVAEIMSAAGLTHGAFYRHFESKDALVAEAATQSMDVFVQAAENAAAAGPRAFIKHLEKYLTSDYRDGMLGGCPVIQIGSELARTAPETSAGVSHGLERLIEIAVQLNNESGNSNTEDDAIFTVSALVGAVTVSRLIQNKKISKRALSVAKQRLFHKSTEEQAASTANERALHAEG